MRPVMMVICRANRLMPPGNPAEELMRRAGTQDMVGFWFHGICHRLVNLDPVCARAMYVQARSLGD